MNLPARMLSLLAPARRLAASALGALLLASCGGGTQIEPFEPTRVIAFGDELSAFTADGRKYAVNGLTTDNTRDCKLLPLWIQVVASSYGYGFAECPVGEGEQKAVTRAAPGARAAELVAQVDGVVAGGGFTDKDLALVLVGMNDVLELYAQYPTVSKAELLDVARQRGDAIAKQCIRMINLGARVVVSTTIDVGLTPYARAQNLASGDSGRSKLLSELSAELNAGIRTGIPYDEFDGRDWGLVLADEYTQSAVKEPGLFGLVNAQNQACQQTAPLPDCDSLTLVTGANPETWLWADEYRLATNFHRQIGGQAESRARGNPF
jgi:hypothetical protein